MSQDLGEYLQHFVVHPCWWWCGVPARSVLARCALARLPAACLPAELLRAGQPHQDCIRKEGRLEQDFPSFRSLLEMKICLGDRHDKFFFIFLWSCGHVNCGRRNKEENQKSRETSLCPPHCACYSSIIQYIASRATARCGQILSKIGEKWQIPQWDRIILVRCCS